jgi:hypothetical protein
MRPYAPEAVDFEQGLPTLERVGPTAKGNASLHGHEHLGAGPVSHRSDPITAPQRFDLVGVAGELRPLELRAREEGGDWSEWVETQNGDPVYTGGSDEVQVRARGWRPSGRLHYVNVSGTAGTTDTLLNSAREAVNGAFISVAGLVSPAADAAAREPKIVSRGAWGANRDRGGCRPRAKPALGAVKAAAIHHTVTANGYSRAEAPRIVLGICRYHRNANGWNDIGYNALVDRFGTIYAGRDGGLARPIVGAHAQGFNDLTTGVAAIGTHTEKRLPRRTRKGIARFLAWRFGERGLRPKEVNGTTRLISDGGRLSRYPRGRKVRVRRLVGHRKLGVTECPGGAANRQLDLLRKATVRRMRR